MAKPSKAKPAASRVRTGKGKPKAAETINFTEYDKRIMLAELEWKEQRAATFRLKRETLEGELIKKTAAADLAAGLIEEIERAVIKLLEKNPRLAEKVSAIFKRYL
jgi:hypothetical protein